MSRALLALLVGLVVGSCGTLVPVAAGPAEQRDYSETRCRGNGTAGYRKCRIDFERPTRKAVVDVYIGGEYSVGFIWRPEPGQWKRVTR